MLDTIWLTSDIAVSTWHLIYLLAAFVSFQIVMNQYLWSDYLKSGLSTEHIKRLFLLEYITSYFGARGYSVIFEESRTRSLGEFFDALFSVGPMTYFGGLLTGLLIGFLYVKKAKLSLWPVLDIFCPAALIGSAIGRIGCFLNGDDYGRVVASVDAQAFWVVRFTNHANALPRYPVQLIEFAILTSAMIALIFQRQFLRQRFFSGALGLICLMIYSFERFFVEFLRDDPRGFFIPGILSSAQGLSIGLFLVSCCIFYLRAKFPPVPNR